MTYGQLSNQKTSSMEVNLILDDIVNNARWSNSDWKNEEVGDYVLNQISSVFERYNTPLLSLIDNAITHRCEKQAEINYLRGV